jgi:hypothetical protein
VLQLRPRPARRCRHGRNSKGWKWRARGDF